MCDNKNMEFYVKPVQTFSEDGMRMSEVNYKTRNYKMYNVDTEHNRTKFSDNNLLILTNFESDDELTPDVLAMRNKVIQNKKKFYYAVV